MIEKIHIDIQCDDILTKPLVEERLEMLCGKLGMLSIDKEVET